MQLQEIEVGGFAEMELVVRRMASGLRNLDDAAEALRVEQGVELGVVAVTLTEERKLGVTVTAELTDEVVAMMDRFMVTNTVELTSVVPPADAAGPLVLGLPVDPAEVFPRAQGIMDVLAAGLKDLEAAVKEVEIEEGVELGVLGVTLTPEGKPGVTVITAITPEVQAVLDRHLAERAVFTRLIRARATYTVSFDCQGLTPEELAQAIAEQLAERGLAQIGPEGGVRGIPGLAADIEQALAEGASELPVSDLIPKSGGLLTHAEVLALPTTLPKLAISFTDAGE